MKITRDVVRDLLPAYFSGEATADTRSVVEEYFTQDPDFAESARTGAQDLRSLAQAAAAAPDPAAGRTALRRTKRVLWWQKVLLALASTLTLNAISLGFSFEVGGEHVHVHWMTLPWQRHGVVVLLLLSALFWVLYLQTSARARRKILG